MNPETVHQRHDTPYRFLLSSKKLFVELLRSFINKGWVQAVNEENVQENLDDIERREQHKGEQKGKEDVA
ncbi:hypothetical protein ABEW32_20760 [Paenibacillus jamilae]|uniref:hypothetical protein n=1 Tax=Paenibacillus jamilae TaxID=114136 RepID=UPI003D26A13C